MKRINAIIWGLLLGFAGVFLSRIASGESLTAPTTGDNTIFIIIGAVVILVVLVIFLRRRR